MNSILLHTQTSLRYEELHLAVAQTFSLCTFSKQSFRYEETPSCAKQFVQTFGTQTKSFCYEETPFCRSTNVQFVQLDAKSLRYEVELHFAVHKLLSCAPYTQTCATKKLHVRQVTSIERFVVKITHLAVAQTFSLCTFTRKLKVCATKKLHFAVAQTFRLCTLPAN